MSNYIMKFYSSGTRFLGLDPRMIGTVHAYIHAQYDS